MTFIDFYLITEDGMSRLNATLPNRVVTLAMLSQ